MDETLTISQKTIPYKNVNENEGNEKSPPEDTKKSC